MKNENIPFYTDGNHVMYIPMSVKVDETGEWLSAEQVERLEALHNWAHSLIDVSDKLKRSPKIVKTAKSDLRGFSFTSDVV